jgi:hypothetical protein
MLSLSLLQARLVDLGMPIKIVGGYLEVQMRLWLKVKEPAHPASRVMQVGASGAYTPSRKETRCSLGKSPFG